MRNPRRSHALRGDGRIITQGWRRGAALTTASGFVAAPSDPWGTSVSANSGGGHGYHVVWTRDEYDVAAGNLTGAQSLLGTGIPSASNWIASEYVSYTVAAWAGGG